MDRPWMVEYADENGRAFSETFWMLAEAAAFVEDVRAAGDCASDPYEWAGDSGRAA